MKKHFGFSLCMAACLASQNLSFAQEEETVTQESFVAQVAFEAGRRMPKPQEVTYSLKQARLLVLQLESDDLHLNYGSAVAVKETATLLDEAIQAMSAEDADMVTFAQGTLLALGRQLNTLEQRLARDGHAQSAIPRRLRYDLSRTKDDLGTWFQAASLPEVPIACGQTETGTFLPYRADSSNVVWLGPAAAGYASMNQCMSALQARQGDLVCVPDGGGKMVGYTPYHISRGERVGAAWGYGSLSECSRALTEVYFGRICGVTDHTSDYSSRYTHLIDLRTLKAVTPSDEYTAVTGFNPGNDHFACRRALAITRPTFACIPAKTTQGRWAGAALYRLTDNKVIQYFSWAEGRTNADDQVQNMQSCTAAIQTME